MNNRKILTIIMAISLILVSFRSFAQTAEELLPEAIQLEEVKGELEKAIEVYQTIVTSFPENKAIAAKAQFHIGLCYEKLGLKEAQKAYQQVLDNYPDQQGEVALAKERLSRLLLLAEKVSKTPLLPKFTKINIPTELFGSVALSPDGKNLALVSNKKLWVMPLTGNLGPDIPGTPVQLKTGDIEVEWSGLDWSRDGKWIAFNDYPTDEKGEYIENQSIYIVPSNGGMPEKVVENFRDVRTINYRISLSANGNNLAFSSVEENKQHIFSTPVDKVIPRQLVEMEAREPVFSPDGKYIAFVKDKNKGIGTGDLGLWVIEANGGKPFKLADAGKASSPIWSPDGKLIAFLDYSVGNQISIVPFSKTENTIGKVIRIDAPEGINDFNLLAGWTHDNKIGALITSKNKKFGLYTLPVEGGQAAKILHDSYAVQPRWSRNCEQIYYVATPEEGENRSYRRFLASVSASGGKGKPLKTNIKGKSIKQFTSMSGNRVSPDGNWIATVTWTPADTNTINVHWPTSKIWKVSVEGEDAIQITNTPGNFTDTSPCWSADGKKIAFVHTELVEGKANFLGDSHIYVIDSNGGEPELLDPNPSIFATNLIWSPDGKMIAYLANEKRSKTKILKIIDIESRDIKVIKEFPKIYSELVWSPDSKRIAFDDADGKVIKIMNLDDGSIEDIETGLVNVSIFNLDWSPDGKRFVFSGVKGGGNEFWFMENFLPKELTVNKQK